MPFDPANPHPIVSVGILTRNAGQLFVRVMDALLAQQTRGAFEIVILDSASRDGTDKTAESKGAKVVPYRPKRFLFGAARDTLFENCRGDVIVTISQDVLPADDHWLEKLTAPILDNRADATVGAQQPHPDKRSFYWDYHGSWMRTVAVQFDQENGQIAVSCADMAIRRDVWEMLRFGDVEAIEDRVMQVKLHRGGYRVRLVEDALSLHGHDYTWRELYNRLGSFAMGWARMGWPYTARRLLRDLAQPSRYWITVDAFINRRLANWQELLYPVAMCFMQYLGSRKKQWR